MRRANLTARAGRWSAEHRRVAILGWLLFVVLAIVAGRAVGTEKIKEEDSGNGEARTAAQTIARAGLKERATEQVLIEGRGRLRVEDPAFRAAVADLVRRVGSKAYVTGLTSPYQEGHGGQISYGGRSALVIFQIKGDQHQAERRVAPILDSVATVQRAHPRVRLGEVGSASSTKALMKAFEDDFKKAEKLSLPITLAILLLAFGALVAAGLPVLLGISAVLGTLGVVGLVSHVSPVPDAISSVVLLIGLAVGVDYSLFYIRRAREERAAGRDARTALEIAAATSGRAVLVSGGTVIVAMAGMFMTGNAIFTGFGVGTILVVACAIVGSLTVLPALLAWLGDRVDRGRVPLVGRLRSRTHGRGWEWVLERVLRRPVLSAVLSTALLVTLAIPAFSLHTVDTGIQGLPPQLEITKTLKRLEREFPGGPQPAQVVVQARDVSTPQVTQALAQVELGALGTGLMREPIQTRVNAAHTVAIVSVPLVGSGTDALSVRALKELRRTVVPNTVGRLADARVSVGGQTAMSEDFNDRMKSRAPWVFAFVLGLAFLLLLVTFRSIVIAAKAVALNMLSVGAAYGILVWVFQDGHLERTLGFNSVGGITLWLPLFLFVVLFGLSMDYHVLILSRIREAYAGGMSTDRAVLTGISRTAGVVTSAAVVMVAVFAVFATLSALDFKMMGVGLAAAVLIDATIVRAVLLPATMKLLGDWNWYLPRWLEWLPQVGHEPAAVPECGPAGKPEPSSPVADPRAAPAPTKPQRSKVPVG